MKALPEEPVASTMNQKQSTGDPVTTGMHKGVSER